MADNGQKNSGLIGGTTRILSHEGFPILPSSPWAQSKLIPEELREGPKKRKEIPFTPAGRGGAAPKSRSY